MPNLIGIFVSDTQFVITCVLEVASGCPIYTEMLGLYAHIAYLPYELYLGCGSHICS